VSIIVASAQCVPTHKYWNPAIEGHCINVTAFLYGQSSQLFMTMKSADFPSEQHFHHRDRSGNTRSAATHDTESEASKGSERQYDLCFYSRWALYSCQLRSAILHCNVCELERAAEGCGSDLYLVFH
jgi:hypothetical protein